MDIREYAKKERLNGMSAVNQEEFRDFFKGVKIKTVVEIGTHKGISAAYMAGFAKKIFTFDIKDYKAKYKVWEDLGVAEKIHYYTIKDRSDIKKVLDTIRFDFAFIDGEHTYQSVKSDYELIKLYGSKLVLLHDVNKKRFPGVKKFAHEIGAEARGNIAFIRT